SKLPNPTYLPASYRSGEIPVQPPQVPGGGQVLLELTVGDDGKVLKGHTLRSTPPFTELLVDAVRLWRFQPAEDRGHEVESGVLVAALFRPPTLMGPAAGEPAKDVTPPSTLIPMPYTMVQPDYPPGALADGVVLVEIIVERDGTVEAARVLRSSAAFDQASTDAVLQWKFRPARRDGQPVPSFAYIIFGFRQPVTPTK
ncbi:unnamed protein product, partial [marine sediment metagenome]